MSFYIEKGEPIDAGVKRIAIEQTDKALASLQEVDNIHVAIHGIRKKCKKLRALLRLVRDDLGEAYFKDRNVTYRDIARKLSVLRDIHTIQNTLSNLKSRYKEAFPQQIYDNINALLEQKKQSIAEQKLVEKDVLAEVVEALQRSKEVVYDWPVSVKRSFDPIAPSLKRVYERGYKALPVAYETWSAEKFHELRKRAKYLWYQTRLLKQIWPRVLHARAKDTRKFTDFLGDDHDLMVLKQVIADLQSNDDKENGQLDRLIDNESALLRAEAKGMAELIYAEEPDDFVGRIHAYWDVGDNE